MHLPALCVTWETDVAHRKYARPLPSSGGLNRKQRLADGQNCFHNNKRGIKTLLLVSPVAYIVLLELDETGGRGLM